VPFSTANDWNPALNDPALAEDAATFSFKNAGIVKALGLNGNQIVPLYDHGSAGFRLSQIELAGTGLVLDTLIDFQNVDWGSSRAVLTTLEGIWFVNDYGVHLKQPTGRTDQRFAMVDQTISEPISPDFFKDFNTIDSDIEEDKLRGLILVPAIEKSTSNNIVLVYHKKKEVRGWAIWRKRIKRFINRDNDIFVTSAGETKVFKLEYDSGDDDGNAFTTIFEFEAKLGVPNELHRLLDVNGEGSIQVGGKFANGEVISFEFDIMDRKGVWIRNAKQFTYTTQNDNPQVGGVGVGGVGEAGIGGDGISFDSFIDEVFPIAQPTTDFLRIRVRMKTSSTAIHELNFLSLSAEPRGLIQT
jgi:hypothetical protein